MKKLKNLSLNIKLLIVLAIILIMGIILRWDHIKTEASKSFNFFGNDKNDSVQIK